MTSVTQSEARRSAVCAINLRGSIHSRSTVVPLALRMALTCVGPARGIALATNTCSVEGCDKPVKTRGRCQGHYKQWWKRNRSSDRGCAIHGCNGSHYARGWCQKHYMRWLKHGDPETRLARRDPGDVDDRFWAKVRITGSCWLWIAGRDDKGYGSFRIGPRSVEPHRYAYEAIVGEIPDGLFLDHTCAVPSCVNPAHLRPVTNKQNVEHATKMRSDNTSGVRGVTRANGKWRAKVRHHGRDHHVGYFIDLADAEAAVVAKRNELFTHNDGDRA